MGGPADPYMAWNDALANHFFDPKFGGRPVYLYVSDDLLLSLGRPFGGDVSAFVSATRTGPAWVGIGTICERALNAHASWRRRNLKLPPYVGFLSLFVLAVGTEGDFAPHAYYPRLRKLLGLSVRGGPLPDFNQMWQLWEDLETWSSQDRRGELGLFEARSVGGFVHIGYPIGQKLLTDSERDLLPRVFWAAEIESATSHSDQELATALIHHGHDHLRSRTLRLLSGVEQDAARQLLLEVVRSELDAWDGTYTPPDDPGASPQARGSIYFALHLDPVAERARLYLRCRMTQMFPEAGLELSDLEGNSYACEEATSGWSTPLHDDRGGELDGANLLSRGVPLLKESHFSWQFRSRHTAVRLFVEGSIENLPDWIEARTLPGARRFAVVYSAGVAGQIERWLRESCDSADLWSSKVLPHGWHLATADRARSDELLRKVSTIGFSTSARIVFVGGVRSGGGTSYFDFALPHVYVEGASPDDALRVSGISVIERDHQGRFALPAGLPGNTRNSVEVVRGGQIVAQRGIIATGPGPWRGRPAMSASDRWGRPSEVQMDQVVSGAVVVGLDKTLEFYPYPFLLPELRSVAERELYFVGTAPGQISEWPAHQLPGWKPVWAIRKQKRKKVLFCGRSVEDAGPSRTPSGSPTEVARWRQLVWLDRYRRPGPDNPRLLALWRQYQEVAASVEVSVV